ncbi:ATP-binding protein [Desulfitobacterium hafniense]|nr:ATP-binding protein [Desulfitobacterium hafniense]
MADKSRQRAHQGSGLGLTIASRIINLHHGDIRVEDNHPLGTIMILTLPG